MKILITGLLFFVAVVTKAQTITTVGGNSHTGSKGILCATNAVNHAENINSSSPADYAQFNLLAGVGCSYYLHSTLSSIGAAGTNAGFHIESLNLLDLFSGITIETYLNGRLQETASGGSLLSLLNGGRGDLYFKTTKAYDALRINISPVVSVANNLRVYWGFGDNSSVATLPLHVQELKLTAQQHSAELQWKLQNSADLKTVVIEKSFDGETFIPVAYLQKQPTQDYTYREPHSQKAWFRIKAVQNDDNTVFSKAILFQPAYRQTASVSPNPAKGNRIVVKGSWSAVQKVPYIIYNATGGAVQSGVLQQEGAIDISNLEKGFYIIKTGDGASCKWSKL